MNILERFLSKFYSYPNKVRQDNQTITRDQVFPRPDGMINITFTNLGEPVEINGLPVATNGILIYDTDPFEQDVTEFDIVFSAGVNPNLVCIYKVKVTE